MQIFINTYGTYLHVKDEMFEIKVRQEKNSTPQIKHIAAKKITSFVISKGTSLSTDAVSLALKYNIDIVLVENDGQPIGRFWHSKLGSTTKIRKMQLKASSDQNGLNWVKLWLTNKLENQADYLRDLKKHRKTLKPKIDTRLDSILALREKIQMIEAENVELVADTLRGLEGSAGRHYFSGLSDCINKDFSFKGRSFRPARDPFNAMLNYGYGILYSRVERALMLAGLDPYLGFLHRDDYNMMSLVFDFIEPYRIYPERFIFKLFSSKKIRKDFFTEITNGFSLNDEGKSFFVGPYLEYLDSDKIKYKGRLQTRMNAMQQDAHQFANSLIKEIAKTKTA